MTTFREIYANATTDLEYFLPDVQAFDRKILLTGWLFHESNVYKAGSTGTIDQLFRDNFELTKVNSLSTLISNNADGEYFYDSSADITYIRSDNNPLTHHTIEGGRDYATLKNTALNRAAEFIRSYINRPILKRLGVGIQSESLQSYDDIIIKANAVLACSELVRPYDQDRADYLQSLAYNPEGNGFLDLIKSGEIALWHDKTLRDTQGKLLPVSVGSNTTGSIIDIRGQASADDTISVKIANGGTLTHGTANTSVTYNVFTGNDDGLQTQQVVTNEPISGAYQQCAHGLQIKWSYGVHTTGDTYYIECSNMIPEAGSPIKSYTIERK
tara:strand:- start:17120 stop:18103 length:984 start_codon:yes stop_codon:yes gene_type:complete